MGDVTPKCDYDSNFSSFASTPLGSVELQIELTCNQKEDPEGSTKDSTDVRDTRNNQAPYQSTDVSLRLIPEEVGFDSEGDSNKNSTISEDSVCQKAHSCLSSIGSSMLLMGENFSRVHVGFWEAYLSIREDLFPILIKYIVAHRKRFLNSRGFWKSDVESQYRGTLNEHAAIEFLDISFCGHSLGGAIAVLASLDLAANMDSIVEALLLTEFSSKMTSVNHIIQEIHSHSEQPTDSLVVGWRPPRVSVYTFGCPRIGNAQLSLQIQQVATVFRVAVTRDIVTMLPKLPFFYSHAGTPVILEADAPGSMIVNPTLIEKSFLRNSTGSVSNHSLNVYRNCLEACFEDNEIHEYRKKEIRFRNQGAHMRRSLGDDNIPEWTLGRR
eukprot:CAMPEP_0170100078 /NCGR_PEP_ID=MMETSP0020_2-20130122/1430_1 /TAXON_ID=98059 /ORGANISM="Dinobryon sp., Strain UTEXLB2267" /LENGTH=382 /DNA_ID=CAMNT_0010322877 /DNA_START=1281 /DNA_END=2429 /DNA_ORIENTATION=-